MKVTPCGESNLVSASLRDGMEYTVYALYISDAVECMVYDENYLSIPFGVSIEDVTITDSRISSYWVVGKKINRTRIMSFSDWANNAYFYQRVVEGVADFGSIWRKQKRLMDSEFFNSNISKYAVSVQKNWLRCENCLNIWNYEGGDEVVQCPSCGEILNVKT